MTNNSTVARIAQVLSEKNSISICLPNNPTLDAVAAGTGLYMALLAQGKNIGIAAPTLIDPNFGLAGQDKIQSNLVANGDNLVVSFPYQEGSVDKVTYNIEAERFNLIIQPREGFPRLDPKQVNYSYSGGKPEVVVTIYAPTLNSLAQLYTSNKEQFTGIDIINIDRHFTNANYGSINHVDKKSASMSEMILSLIQELKAPLDKDIATNLYAGISGATNNFSAHSVTAETFEFAALLLKSGAVKRSPAAMANPMASKGLNQGFGAYQQPFTTPSFGAQSTGQQSMGSPLNPQSAMGQQPMSQLPMGQQPYDGYQPFPSQQAMPPMSPMQRPMDNMSMAQPPMQQPPMQEPMTQRIEQPGQTFGVVESEEADDHAHPHPHPHHEQPDSFEQNSDQGQDQGQDQDSQVSFQNIAGPDADPQLIENKEIKPKSTPKDWLKPKIFKGTKLS